MVANEAILKTNLDPTTGLPGRLEGARLLADKCSQVGIANVSAVIVEISGFGQINCSVGSKFADKVLKLTANRLVKLFPYALCCYRSHSDQFCILFDRSANICFEIEKLNDFMQRPLTVNSNIVVLTIRVGVAEYTQTFESPEQLLHCAELALHQSKGSLESVSFFKKSMVNKAKARHKIANDLLVAMVQNATELASGAVCDEFYIEYQPLISSTSNTVYCLEALLRWRHPQIGLVSPADFVPVAEKIGVMDTLGKWVIARACRDLSKWRQNQDSYENVSNDLSVSVNISPPQFKNIENLLLAIEDTLKDTDLPEKALKLEIKESEKYADLMQDALFRFKDLGCHLILDDFGAGYSSLSRIIEMPLDFVKIDTRLIQKLDSKNQKRANASVHVAKALFTLASSLNLSVITEGVETQQQLDKAKSLDADLIQGYFFSKALPSKLVGNFLTSFGQH